MLLIKNIVMFSIDLSVSDHQSEIINIHDLSSAYDFIKKIISNNKIVLFMKGTKFQPFCGFSSKVAGILNALGVDFVDINILRNEILRSAIKTYSDWPTFPQLYVDGKLIGGSDIVGSMYENGELIDLLSDKNTESSNYDIE